MNRISVTDRRAALLDAAVHSIATLGIGGTSIRAIVTEAGMPLASFHYAFASRDAMLAALVDMILLDHRAAVSAAVLEADTVDTFLHSAMQAYFDRVVAAPEVEVALQQLVVWSRSVPSLIDMPSLVYEGHSGSAMQLVVEVREQFGVTWRELEEDVARFVVVLLDGVVVRWLADRDERSARQMLRTGTDALLAMTMRA